MLTKEFKNFIKEDALKQYPNECCGIIINGEIIAGKNVSLTPIDNFIMDQDMLDLYDARDISAFYHSHQQMENFSEADIAFSERLNKNSILYVCDKDIFKTYEPIGIIIPYVNRPFLIGEFDCFTLSRDYLQRELNIHVPDVNGFTNHPEIRNYRKWKTDEYDKYANNTLIKDFFVLHGFTEVGDLKKHDIILTKMPGVKFTSHICIYLGENRILHHFSELSGIISYSNAIKRLTTHVLRHSSLM